MRAGINADGYINPKVSARTDLEPSAQHTFSPDIKQSSKMFSLALIAAAIVPSAIAAPQGSRSPINTHVSVEDNVSSIQQSTSYYDWSKGAVNEYEIHQSCNATQNALLRQALIETEMLAGHARDHIQRFGNSSSYYTKYFGKASTAEPAGWYDQLVNGNKAGVLFRCDDPDQNCATQDGE